MEIHQRFIFKGNPGLIAGSGTKRFYNFQVNAGANVSDLVASAGDIPYREQLFKQWNFYTG
jgi:hypothetical protein